MTIIDHQLPTIKKLTRDVFSVVHKYEQIAALTGEGFNIFQLLGLITDEVGTHSVLLAELLNPRGKHGLGSRFLEHFLDLIDFREFDVSNVSVCGPYTVGPINTDYTEGGSIDILIKSGRQCIAIENKIHAGEQKNQLWRYQNFCRKFKESRLVFLTLDGRDGSSCPTGNMLNVPIDYVKVSYAKDVVEWLVKCRMEAAQNPLVRETITQYIHLIKSLTGQSHNQLMSSEIDQHLLSSPETLKAMVAINERTGNIRQQLLHKFAMMLKESFNEKRDEDEDGKLAGFEMKFDEEFGLRGNHLVLENLKYEHAIIMYMADNFCNPVLAIATRDGSKLYQAEIARSLEHLKLGKHENWPYGWTWVERYLALHRYFTNVEDWSELAGSQGKMRLLDQVLESMIACADAVVDAHNANSNKNEVADAGSADQTLQQ
jgi:hypothetical protein